MRKEELLEELFKLTAAEPVKQISSPGDVYPNIQPYGFKEQEHFLVVTLSGAHKVIDTHCISIGIVNHVIVHPREVFRPAIVDNAVSVILAHNHPSGNLEPSKEDRDITHRLQEAGVLLGIEVLDHLVINKKGYYSFLEKGDI